MKSTRIKPYSTNQTNWKNILDYDNIIPMNQRQYAWESREIKKFADDIITIFEEEKYIEKMGSILHYTGNGVREIWDGQQRTITIMIMLLVLGNKYPKLKNTVISMLTVDMNLHKLKEHQQKTYDKYKEIIENIKIPKLYCITPIDQEALVYLINDKYKSIYDYLLVDTLNDTDISENEDNEDNQENDEGDKHTCKICNVKIGRLSDFKRHLLRKHSINFDDYKSKIYECYENLTNYFSKLDYKEEKAIELFHFITNDIDIQIYESSDHKYVSKIFDWENNRGKNVHILDNIKNLILSNIVDDKKDEVFEKWSKYKNNNIFDNFYPNINEKIFDVAIQIYNFEKNKEKIVERKIDNDELYSIIIKSEDSYKSINEFFNVIDSIYIILNKIREDRFGRLIFSCKGISLAWETYSFCLIPIFYLRKNSINKQLIKLLTLWYFRNFRMQNISLNRFLYSDYFIKISNSYCKDIDKYDYFEEILDLLIKNIDKIKDEKYEENLCKIDFNNRKAVYLLYFYETCKTSDTHQIRFEYSIEHIIPQNDKDKLKEPKNINKIGNLTLLEKSNSDNGHKGNFSLKNKSYEDKKDSYSNSSSIITKSISEEYESFEEKDIIDRTKKIAKELDSFTNFEKMKRLKKNI